MPLGKVWKTPVTTISATLTHLAGSVNDVRWEDGNMYRLVKANAAGDIVRGAVCKVDTVTPFETVSGVKGLLVMHSATPLDNCIGVNATGADVTASYYFWMLQAGIGEILTDGGVSADDFLSPAAAGATDTRAVKENVVGVALADDSGNYATAYVTLPSTAIDDS